MLAVCWTKKGDDAGGHAVCDVTEVTVGNVAGVLGRLAIGCRYDVVKVEVGPGTNGGVRGGKKGGGKVYGKAGGKSGV